MKKLLGPVAMVLLVAGCGSSSSALHQTASPTASATAASPTPAISPTPDYAGLWPRSANIAFDSTRKNLVLFGGNLNRSGLGNDTWVWSAGRWTQQNPAANPPVRQGAVLVDEPEMHSVLLFGGADTASNMLNDTWAWNGINWVQLFPAHSPSPRYGAAAAWDAVRHVVLLFGGGSCICAGGLDDTWTWNGQDWTQAHPTQSPTGRGFARLAVDVAHGEAVLFGGFEALNDTWTWDGATWTLQHPTNTPPAINEANAMAAQMVYDTAKKVVVFAGPNQRTRETETFTWSASDWTPVKPTHNPPAREGAGLAYDEAAGITVYAGGLSMGGDVTRTWGFDGTDWMQLD